MSAFASVARQEPWQMVQSVGRVTGLESPAERGLGARRAVVRLVVTAHALLAPELAQSGQR